MFLMVTYGPKDHLETYHDYGERGVDGLELMQAGTVWTSQFIEWILNVLAINAKQK